MPAKQGGIPLRTSLPHDRTTVSRKPSFSNQTMAANTNQQPPTAIVFPVLAIAFIFLAPLIGFDAGAQPPSTSSVALSVAMVVIMLGAVFAAVHHADVIAHRIGEPFGTLVLTLAVTVIEVALIESIVLTPGSSPALARDTVFAVIMVVCNGLVGLCILWGGLRHHEQEFQASGASVYLTVLGALSILTLVLPNYTATTTGPYFSNAQLVFVSIITIVLYAAFLFIQTSRHTDYFRAEADTAANKHHIYPSNRTVVVSAIMLLVALCGVILIAKKFAIILEIGLFHIGAPPAVAGIVIAVVVLAPESITAVRAAQRNELQKSLNLALGSSLATIGLTIPAVAITNVFIGKQIEIGLSERDTLLLALTLFLSLLTFGSGRTNILAGLVHLVVFATFLFLVFVP
ncbi:MAG TPA: ionic transporter y4hA [Burkholderiales bacterium]|nr:ionic transporter y4hA [Burkholderiales bacterium]